MKLLAILGLPALALGAWTGASWYVGSKAEQAYQGLVAETDAQWPVHLESGPYESGLLDSRAVTHVRASESPDGPILFSLKHTIEHAALSADGIGAVTVETRLLPESLSDKQRESLAVFENDDPFLIVSRRAADGELEHEVTLHAFDAEENGNDFIYSGGVFTVSQRDNVYKAAGKLGDFFVLGDDSASFSLTDTRVDADFSLIGDWLYTGDTTLLIGKMTASNPAYPADIELTDLRVFYSGSEQNDHYDMVYRISGALGDLPVELDSVSLELTASNLSTPAMRSYMQQLKALVNKAGLRDGTDAEQTLTAEALLREYRSLKGSYADWFVPGSSIRYAVTASNAGGEADIDLGIKVLDSVPENFRESIATVGDLLSAIRLELNFDADAEAVNRTPLVAIMLSPMAQQFVVADEQSYRTTMFTEGQTLHVNGESLPLDQMVGDALQMPLSVMLDGIH